jgi:hypothetical protein
LEPERDRGTLNFLPLLSFEADRLYVFVFNGPCGVVGLENEPEKTPNMTAYHNVGIRWDEFWCPKKFAEKSHAQEEASSLDHPAHKGGKGEDGGRSRDKG